MRARRGWEGLEVMSKILMILLIVGAAGVPFDDSRNDPADGLGPLGGWGWNANRSGLLSAARSRGSVGVPA